MFTKHKFSQFLFSIIIILTLTLSSFMPTAVLAQSEDGIKRQFNAESGRISFIGPESGRVLLAGKALGTSIRPQDPAMALANRYAPEFGLDDPARDLTEMKAAHLDDGRLSVRYQQTHNGIPVMGAELIVNTNDRGDLYSMSGEMSPNLSLSTDPTIDSVQAAEAALGAVAKWYGGTPADFVASEPELWIFDESLLRSSARPVELVWRIEVTSTRGIPLRELVLVNAQRGGISLHFNQVDAAWHSTGKTIVGRANANFTPSNNKKAVLGLPLVSTYTTNSTSSLPGTFLCDQTQPNCTSGSNLYADGAHKYAIGTYNFYATNFNRDSIDNNGMTIISTVDYCDPNFVCPFSNAYWSGEQMVYGSAEGWPLADDVVGHELTHGVTDNESDLFYYYQSGAINESFSDLWGEYYDQTNGEGNDAANVKWIIGEDISGYPIPSGFSVPALRSMSDPPALGDPDKMSSPNYYETEGDSGGVHHNSGLNNKAVYLMVDGGTFNGKTVTALGWEKTGAIYYEVQTNLLISGADYSDLYYALQQACTILVGQHGITSGDCVEVKDAIDAVEMNDQPAPNFNTDAPICDVGDPLNTIFFDDLETGSGNWEFASPIGETRWQYDSAYGPFATSGEHMLFADDAPAERTDTNVKIKNAVHIPSGTFMRFSHAFGFEDDVNGSYDGGVLEYSTNNGSTWLDAGSLFLENGYTGTIYPDANNPLKGKEGFVRDSHGYISSRLNLESLAGQNVLFRWRMGLDSIIYDWGWWLDDVHIYTCDVPPLQASFSSTALYDGWILETSENGNNGGVLNSGSTIFYLGDDAQNKQYRAILHFDTSSLPDTAVIVDAKLRLATNEVVTGTNPFTTHDKIVIELNTGPYSSNTTLQLDDFKVASDRNGAGAVRDNLVNGFYRGRLKGDVLEFFNLTGATQIRLRFKTDDDDDGVADIIEFFSGNASGNADRPRLVLYYTVP